MLSTALTTVVMLTAAMLVALHIRAHRHGAAACSTLRAQP
jgi:hypothetical protein